MSHRFVTELPIINGFGMLSYGQDRLLTVRAPRTTRRCRWIDARVTVVIRVEPEKGGVSWSYFPLGRRAERVPFYLARILRLAPIGALSTPIITSSRHWSGLH